MLNSASRILIVGGGFSGMAAAIELRRQGAEVDIVELDPDWRTYGAGISLGGATLRAFRQLGVLDAFLAQGSAGDGARLFTPQGHPIAELPTPRVAGPDVPGSGAIMRPVLAAILRQATLDAGARAILGQTVERLQDGPEGIEVTFSDGRTARYDLVIGADGLYSRMRGLIFPEAPAPAYSGQCVWRAVVPRPEGLDSAVMWLGPRVKCGVNPVSDTEAYLFITEDRPDNAWLDPAGFYDQVMALCAPFTAPMMQQIRDSLTPDSQIVYRPLEAILLPRPWYRGRVVLIGDAVHATTPHLASGACIGIEDALVLVEELGRADTLDTALAAFQARRWDRCRMVVENSLRLGEIEITGGDKAEHAAIMRQSLMALAAPI